MRPGGALLALLLGLGVAAAPAAVPVHGYTVIATHPHDTGAFTQGLFWHEGALYESTGEVGRSSIRKVDLETGEVVQRRNLKPPHFGEGSVILDGLLYQLTWKSGRAFVYDAASFEPRGERRYRGEGWGLTTDGTQLYMSDGTPEIRVLAPDDFSELRRIRVTWDGHPVGRLNELEWIDGELWANVWLTRRIARIDPESGHITAFVDLSGLEPARGEVSNPWDAVANGIAWDAAGRRLFVTGKNWPHLYQIELAPPAD